jgi:hypothetical protein
VTVSESGRRSGAFDLLRSFGHDSLRAADGAEPVALSVALQLADGFGTAGSQASDDGVDVLDGEGDVADTRRARGCVLNLILV